MRRRLSAVAGAWQFLARGLLSLNRHEREHAWNHVAARTEMLARDQAHRLRIKRLELNPTNRKPQVVVSLTSIPSRLGSLPLVIKGILRQTLPPDRIVLWLSEDYRARSIGALAPDAVPAPLRTLEHRGLEICWAEDIGPHGKLLHALKRFPDDIIITVDDDVHYPRRAVESLYDAYRKHGDGNVYCRRSRVIRQNGEEADAGYSADEKCRSSKWNGERLLAQGVGGVLYPPGTFTEEVFNRKAFTEIAPHEDDCWFTAMAMLNGRRVFQIDAENIAVLPSHSINSLQDVTKGRGRGEFNRQLTAVIRRYGLEL